MRMKLLRTDSAGSREGAGPRGGVSRRRCGASSGRARGWRLAVGAASLFPRAAGRLSESARASEGSRLAAARTLGKVSEVRLQDVDQLVQELKRKRRLGVPRRDRHLCTGSGTNALSGGPAMTAAAGACEMPVPRARLRRRRALGVASTHRVQVAVLDEHKRGPIDNLDRTAARLLTGDDLECGGGASCAASAPARRRLATSACRCSLPSSAGRSPGV